MPGAGDQQGRANADELGRFVEDDLDAAGIGFVAGELAGLLRRLDVRQRDDSSLDLRHRLLRDDDDVTVPQVSSCRDQRREIVPLPQLREPFDRCDGEARRDVLDEDQGGVVLVPELVELLECDEADGRVERACRVVAAAGTRRAERLDMEVAEAVRSAP